MMLPRIIFCTAVSLATLAVILLAVLSPISHRKQSEAQSKPWIALSMYIQQSHNHIPNPNSHPIPAAADAAALIFHHLLTQGPKNTSRVVGKAQGFVIPVEQFAHSAFNVIYLTFDTPEYSGSLTVQAKQIDHKEREELTVVGGTGSFAFARGIAVFSQTDGQESDLVVTYRVELQLRFPNHSRTVPG